jgi:thymidine kinase
MRHTKGSIEVICGPMYCGKTEELIRRLFRAKLAKQNVQVFKPIIDDRYGGIFKISSHSGSEFEAIPVKSSDEIKAKIEPNTTVVGFDEVQFFDEGILDLATELADSGIRVIIAGLDLTFTGEPFGVMPNLMAVAEQVSKLSAICMVCGDLASRSQRLVNGKPAHYNDPIIIVGASEMYEARCRDHHIVPKD